MKYTPTIRVIWWTHGPSDQSGLLIEQLRRMGLVRQLGSWQPKMDDELAADEERGYQVLEFEAPKGLDAKLWCEQNCERMRSFDINAVVAPKWLTESGDQNREAVRAKFDAEAIEKANSVEEPFTDEEPDISY